jgi:LacI family transcriptional regulator
MARRRIKRVLVAATDDTPLVIPLLDGITAFTKQAEPWLICPTSNGEQLLEIVENVKPDGLIVARVSSPLPIEKLAASEIPCIFVGISEAVPKQHPVLIGDHPLIGRTGARHLLDTRAVSYGFVGYGDTVFSKYRRDAFLEELRNLGHSPHNFDFPPFVAGTEAMNPYGREATSGPFAKWLLGLPRPIALMAANDQLAHLIALACIQMQLRIPEDVALLGVDDIHRYCQTVVPPLSTIRAPVAEIGWEAARLLNEWMHGHRPEAGVRAFSNIELIPRQSTMIHRIDDDVISKALLFITENIERHFTVTDIQRHVGASRRTLELRFQEVLGRTPLVEIRRQRVEHAKKLLGGTQESVQRISKRCGFNSMTRFCIVFREQTGLRPLGYRRKINPGTRKR